VTVLDLSADLVRQLSAKLRLHRAPIDDTCIGMEIFDVHWNHVYQHGVRFVHIYCHWLLLAQYEGVYELQTTD